LKALEIHHSIEVLILRSALDTIRVHAVLNVDLICVHCDLENYLVEVEFSRQLNARSHEMSLAKGLKFLDNIDDVAPLYKYCDTFERNLKIVSISHNRSNIKYLNLNQLLRRGINYSKSQFFSFQLTFSPENLFS
jgi:hypothetical protein